MANAIEVVRIPALDDNYIWLVHDSRSQQTVVIDPAVADPVLAEASLRGWHIDQIWNTHWHADHIGGNAAIQEATGASIAAPKKEADRIPNADIWVDEGTVLLLGDEIAVVWAVPGHTLGHVAFHFEKHDLMFVGDTLFAMGCGRLFEGTPEQMWSNMRRLAALPDDTLIFCAHEYTLANGQFAASAEPSNQHIRDRLLDVINKRQHAEATVPTTIGLERLTNPFMRAGSAEELAKRRRAKEKFTN